MESIRLISLFAFLLGAQCCRVDIIVTENRGVWTATCTLNCSSTIEGFKSAAVSPGFRAYYEEDSLAEQGYRVCMKAGEGNVIDQCVVEDATAAMVDDCMEVEQTAVPDIYELVGGKWMAASTDAGDWAAGTKFCAENGGVLARPGSLNETLAIAEFMGEDHAYIGVNDIDTEGTYFFNDATVNSALGVGWTNWNTGEPNNNYGTEHCVVLRANKEFRWNDVTCTKSFKALCQYLG